MNNINHNGEENWRNSGVSQSFSINEIESLTGLDFFSEIPDELEDLLESRDDSSRINSANLLADSVVDRRFFNINSTGQSDLPQESIFTTEESIRLGKIYSDNSSRFKIDLAEITPVDSIFSHNNTVHSRTREISTPTTTSQESSSSKISITQTRQNQASSFKQSTYGDNSVQICFLENSVAQVGTTEISTQQIGATEIDSSEVSTSKVNSLPFALDIANELDSGEISFSSSIPTQKLVNSHFDHTDNSLLTNIYSTAQTLWNNSIQLDIDFQITDLPKGQLAEATITGFDKSGKPNAGKILIDRDANGVGWFVDSTPLENSEFGVRPKGFAPYVLKDTAPHIASSSENYLLAAAESEASGKYDLLTTVLHELSHLYGFIDGYQGFSDNIETKNGTTKFIGDDFTATLDGEHLDKQAHPYDLLNTHLAPGMRKLPSELDVQVLQAILGEKSKVRSQKSEVPEEQRSEGNLNAQLTSDPLLAISNGDFSIADTTTNTFAWDTRGASGIENAQAVLTEDSPFQSNFTQTFTVPEAAKTIQFKLVETELGASELAPPDAFEVALLDADTKESLTSDLDLTATDSLLNIQPDGTAHFSDKVRIGGATSGSIINLDKSRTVTIDISDLTPGTEATLYFDLLGFGDVDSRVVIDDVKLSDQNLLPPVAQSDRTTTTQGKPVTIDILANDSDDDGAIATESVQIQTEPGHGTVQVNQDGTVTYTPGVAESYAERNRFTGTDTFTYLVADNDGQQSEEATVTVNVANAAPKITQLQIPDNITEGDEVELEAIASDPGNDDLTYTWDLGSQKLEVRSQKFEYTFSDNGTYTGKVTVTDTHGGSDTQDFEVVVQNAAPVVDAGSDQTVDEGKAIALEGSYTDAGREDTHTVEWDFGDDSEHLTLNSEHSTVSHVYRDNREYTATYSVTDNDGAIASDEVNITVNNVSPVIESITGDTESNEGEQVSLEAIASDPGDDTLTYAWDFGDGSETVMGQNVEHIFADNGLYEATLTVTKPFGLK